MTTMPYRQTLSAVELILAAVVDLSGRIVDRYRLRRKRLAYVPRHSTTVPHVDYTPGRATVTYRRTRRPGRLSTRQQMDQRRGGAGADPRWHTPTPPMLPTFKNESEDQ